MGEGEALPWLKAMPLAPEFYPTEAELADPVAYILKIEKEASQYGICKIIPPIPKSSKKAVIANLNLCLGQNNNINTTAASGLYHGSSVNNNVLLNDNGVAKFSTRQQQIGWSLKRSRGGGPVQTVVQKSVWQSGETYTLEQFEAKAKLFSRSRLKTTKDVAPLIVETLFWKASADKPITVEYANDIPGTAFGEPNKKLSPPSTPSVKRKGKKRRQCKQKKDEGSHDVCEISNTAWNMRIVSRSNGSLLRYMPVEVAGVTSPMIYIAMLFSWFAWHVEDHDLHSLNYLHMGAPKTWYAVPGEAASAFEEVVRQEGYGGQVNPLVAFAMLGEKTTVMSPEVLIAAGVPCCRLVQNAGEFVVTFPRAYHLGFSHGFNCGEAANLATPEWLKVAKEAAVRRAATKFLPMLSHQQLLYLLALGSTSRIPVNVGSEPRSSRLKYRQRGGGEMIVKKRFLNDVIENNKLLSNLLQKTSTQHAILWNSANVSCDFPSSPLCFSTISGTKSRASFRVDGMDVSTLPSETAPNISAPACRKDSCIESSLKAAEKETSSRIGSSLFNNVKQENADSSYYAEFSGLHNNDNDNDKGNKAFHRDILSSERDADTGPLACIVCGVLGFASMAVIQPCQEAASVLFSTNCMIGQNYFMTDGAAATHSETHFMADQNGLNNKIVQLNQHGAATAYKNAYAYQHVIEKMDMVNMKAIVQSESLEPIGESSGLFSESNNQKEFPSSIPNDACMPNALSVGNNLGMPQITALDLLAATYGDSMDSDEENDSNITNTSNHVCGPSNGALVSEIRHDLCDTADSPKVNVYASKDPNLQGSPHLSSCALAGKVRKEEETHDVLISGGLKPENKCSFVDTGPKDSFSNSMRTDTNVAGDSSIRSPDQYPNRNMTLQSSVSEDWNGFQGETNVSDIQFPVVEGNNELQKHISAPSVFENVLDTILDISLKETLDSSVLPSNQLGDPSEVSGNNKKPSGMIISHTRDSKGDLTQTELIAEKYNLEVIPESKSYTRDHEAAKSGIDGCTHCFETPHVYDCQPAIQDPLHYESKETHANNDGSISMSIRSNKTRTCDIVGATRSHAAETGSLQGKPYDTPRQSTNAASFWKPTKGFLRPRVFCLEHALEIKEQLQPMGGAHFLILCHLSYPIMEQQARLLAAEIGNDYSWNDIPFKNVASEDLEVIHLAIDDGEDTEPGSSDWTMQLGVNLQYSVKLSKSPLYSTQMPYNQVLEALFLNSYLNNYTAGSAYGSAWDCDMKKQGKKSKHKKITVAGKWCGRVWMVNQVHPFLRSCEVQPSASFGAETIKIGFNQEQGHIQKCMVQEVDCKPILKQRTIITSDKDMVAHQEDSHFQNYTGQDPDSKLILKPRMTITSDKAVTFTRNDQPLMTYRKNTHNPPISRRSAVKGKMCSERQINNIKAEPSEYTTVSVDGRTPLPNQRKEFQEDSTMTIAEDAKVAASCVTRMKQREKVVGHGNYVQAKNNHYQGDMSQADIEIQYSKGNIGKNIGGIQNKTNRQSGLKDEVEVLTYQSSEVQCLENTLISNSHAVSHSYSSTGELEGGPCTRLRPRSTKPKVEVVNKVADKALQQSVSSKTIFKGKKKVAKAVPSKNDEDKNTYCCDTEGCTMKFSSKHDINLHKRNICAFKGCGKHFFSHKYLVQHRRVHLDERPLSCPWEGCEMTFKWAWARTEHIRVHTGERPYVCTTAGCGQTFRFVSDFSRHKRKTGHLPKK